MSIVKTDVLVVGGSLAGMAAALRIKEKYPEANIVAVDYDPGASEVNQLNRIKLMLSSAKKNLEAKNVK